MTSPAGHPIFAGPGPAARSRPTHPVTLALDMHLPGNGQATIDSTGTGHQPGRP